MSAPECPKCGFLGRERHNCAHGFPGGEGCALRCGEIRAEDADPDTSCSVPPEGWVCSRAAGHEGPCAARPDDPYDTKFIPSCEMDVARDLLICIDGEQNDNRTHMLASALNAARNEGHAAGRAAALSETAEASRDAMKEAINDKMLARAVYRRYDNCDAFGHEELGEALNEHAKVAIALEAEARLKTGGRER